MTEEKKTLYCSDSIVEFDIAGGTVSYKSQNSYYNASYRPHCYVSLYRVTGAGFNAGKSCYIGVALYNSTAPTTKTLMRDVYVEVLSVDSCSIELLDEPVLKSAFYDATNYAGITNADGYSLGHKHTGDANSIDRLCYASYQPKAGSTIYGTQIILSADGETYHSICTSRSTGTTKKHTDEGFLPEFILYDSDPGAVSAGNRIATSAAYRSIPFDARYSHNLGSKLVAHKPCYLKSTLEDGLFYLTDDWWTQTVPTEEDGFYYIFVGFAYSTSSIYIDPVHPIYKFYSGKFRRWYECMSVL